MARLHRRILGIGLGLALASCADEPPVATPEQLARWQPGVVVRAPDIQLQDLGGNPVQLAHYRGRPVILDFWASWCGPCMRESPHLREIRSRYASQGLEVIGIAVAEHKPIDALRVFVEQRGITYPMWTGSPAQLRDVARRYGQVHRLPTTFFLDRNHEVRSKKVGYRNLDSLEQYVKDML